MKILGAYCLTNISRDQGAVASRISPPRKKPVYICIKKQAQCEPGSSYEVWLALKTIRLWLMLRDETPEAPTGNGKTPPY